MKKIIDDNEQLYEKTLVAVCIGICIEKELLQWKVNESVEKIICRKKCEENLFF